MEQKKQKLVAWIKNGLTSEADHLQLQTYTTEQDLLDDEIKLIRNTYRGDPRLQSLEHNYQLRYDIRKILRRFYELKEDYNICLSNLAVFVASETPQIALMRVKKYKERYEEIHGDLIDYIQRHGLFPDHLEELRFLLDDLALYYGRAVDIIMYPNSTR